MISHKIPTGIRLGISHYWLIPYYKFKNIAFSESMLKYLKLLVSMFFMKFSKLKTNKVGSIIFKEFFLNTKFNFWEFETINVYINILSQFYIKPRYVPRRYFYTTVQQAKKKASMLRVKSLYKVKNNKTIRYVSTKNYLWLLKVLTYYQYNFTNKGYRLYSGENLYPVYTWGDKDNKIYWKKFSFNMEASIIRVSYTLKLSTYYIINRVKSYLKRYLLTALPKVWNLNINLGWPVTKYFYYCYLLYITFLKNLSVKKNLAKFYIFYRKALLFLIIRDIPTIFYFFKKKLVAYKVKNIYEPHNVFKKFIIRFSILPFSTLGIKSVNIQFNGRVKGRKKNWTRTKKLSIGGNKKNPLSTLKATYNYYAEGFSTKFGIYGIKVWLLTDDGLLTKNIVEVITKIQKNTLTLEERDFLLTGIGWVRE